MAGYYDVTVTASDGTDSATAGFSISVRTTGAPSFTSDSFFVAAENQTSVGMVTATDAESDNITSIEITGGADKAGSASAMARPP